LALAELASALLHYPHLTQALPVLALPPVFFPTTAALLRGRIEVGQELLPPAADLPSLTHSLAEALRQGHKAWLSLRDGDQSVLPAWVQDLLGWAKAGRLPLTVAVHHGMGGVAVDAWGRTSAPGLYACGEAAGGVQGRQRLFGTGLLEARIFALRAAEAVMRDLPKLGPAPQEGAPSLLPLPLDGRQLEAHLDQWMGPLAVIRPTEEAEQVLRHLQSWPAGREGDGSQWLTALRWQAAQVILASQLQGEAGGGKEEAYELARGKSL
jgi:L-aspartate oxidase